MSFSMLVAVGFVSSLFVLFGHSLIEVLVER
jgi:hypothetical protein